MEVQSGRLILGTGLPVYDDEGNIVHALSASKGVKGIKEVKEINELVEKLESISKELDSKDREIAELQDREISHLNYVMASEAMEEVQRTVSRIAPLMFLS